MAAIRRQILGLAKLKMRDRVAFRLWEIIFTS